MYNKTTATWLKNDYIRIIEKVEYSINKNFQQMDLQNVKIKDTMETEVTSMISKCVTTGDTLKQQVFE